MLSQFVVRRPRLVITAVVLLTAFFAFGLRKGLELDVSPLAFVAQNSQERRDFAEARKHFGADDYLLIAVTCENIFDPPNLLRLRTLHQRIERLPGVAEVLSLSNVPYARSLQDGASLEKLIPEKIEASPRLTEARAVATTDKLFAGNLVSADARTAALTVLLKPNSTKVRHNVTRQIYDLTKQSGFDDSFLAGDPFSQWRATEAVKKDLTLFLPLTIVLIALLLWLCFRSAIAVVLPLATIGIGLLWLVGLMAWLDVDFTILALMLPTLMLAIGCSYLIHVINQIGIAYNLNKEAEKAVVLESAMHFINLPVLVSALTIIAGFLSLAFTEIPAVRSTAVFAAFGAAFTMMLSLTLIPAVLALLPARMLNFRCGLHGKMVASLEGLGQWATSHQPLLYTLTALIIVGSIIGVGRIKIDIDYFHFFKPNSETSTNLAAINKRLAGAVTFDIVVEGKQPGHIESPEVLRRIA
ncbi:MAG TPA: MMPL family transporter, partial [Blastocatellia bacterium]|nr:MMPL family transporter [Blastocatellia bacterium]